MKTTVKMLSLLTAMFFFMNLSAQPCKERKFSVGINLINNEYVGDLGTGIFDVHNIKPAIGADVNFNLNKFFAAGIGVSFGQYGYTIPTKDKRLDEGGDPLFNFKEKFMGLKFDMNALGYFKFNNGLILPENTKLEPFIAAGIGFAKYFEVPSLKATGVPPYEWPMIIVEGLDFIIPVGAGVTWHISNKLALKYTYLYNLTFSEYADKRDETMGILYVFPVTNTTNDNFGKQMIGISYKF